MSNPMNSPCGLEECDCGHIIDRLVEAMEEIKESADVYGRDRFTRAESTIENMKRLAQVASRDLHR